MIDRPPDFDLKNETERIIEFLREYLIEHKKDGFVVGLSGGIDSALMSSLCVKAVGKEKVFGLILPEKESNPISSSLAVEHADNLGISYSIVDITPVLEVIGTYEKRDEVIKSLFPGYEPSQKIKLYLPPCILENDCLNFFSLEVLEDERSVFTIRLKKRDLLRIMAATDTKQRTRMIHLYIKAEAENYAVCGTTNRTELLLGYFVKYGDGGVDLEPIAHLNKAHVYELAGFLNIHHEIIERPPSPDTFSSFVTDEEFFLRVPYVILDKILETWESGLTPKEASMKIDLTEEQISRVYRDIESKYRASAHLRTHPPSLYQRRVK